MTFEHRGILRARPPSCVYAILYAPASASPMTATPGARIYGQLRRELASAYAT